ncbi:M23 family metallopeptidase [Crossiella cryophila]|uniref:Murein DD-endopeptidase MepM/ murein hydrolase activator NlpD n=1 Tax=Crossiella cryophila TaxID=43355 RepID=A0A7W7FRD7_9PSEU|nr:M23 family metallopeptidase [Crossiella cryophila]MBB4674228.1 murein DD-endopeptidase MepM/ murein hydrolase activator NlpD [Crossiella cryophila]
MVDQQKGEVRPRGAHRLPPPSSAMRGRVVVAAVAAGAFVAAGSSLGTGNGTASANDEVTPLASGADASANFTAVGGDSLEVLPLARSTDSSVEYQKLAKSERLKQDRAARDAEARRPMFVSPAKGVFTSGFGGRWGTTHYGIDIANRLGTEIVAVADGEVIEAGPASGFGLWVRVQHKDGTITVYGHMDRITVKEGQKVKADQQIATMGNRGFSTGVHLHFEVWSPSGKKINPLPWLNERGVFIK